MIAGFIFLRLRGILGRKSEFEDEISTGFNPEFHKEASRKTTSEMKFDEEAKINFLKGAKIAYENIITSFSVGNLSSVKNLLDKKIFDQFQDALADRKKNSQITEMTFIGINSAEIKNHQNNNGFLEVQVDFVSEIISCVKNGENKVLSGDPKKVKKVYDSWKFSKNVKSNNPNWILIATEN